MYDIYTNSPDNRLRFTLGKSGGRKLLTIGLNPSTATQERSDTTAAKVEQVSRQKDFDGFVMLNLYPVRSTDFNQLPLNANKKALAKNLEVIETLVAAESHPTIWAAWGAHITARPFFVSFAVTIVERLQQYRVDWRHFGPLTIAGHPRHPSRLNYAWEFRAFDADGYVRQMRT
jgi:hypothetical protein